MCFLRASLMLLSELIFSTFWQLEMRSSLSVCLDLLARYFLIWRRNRMRAIVIHSSITHVKKMLAGGNINKNVLLKERNTQMLSCLWSNTFSFLEPSVEARNSPFLNGQPFFPGDAEFISKEEKQFIYIFWFAASFVFLLGLGMQASSSWAVHSLVFPFLGFFDQPRHYVLFGYPECF